MKNKLFIYTENYNYGGLEVFIFTLLNNFNYNKHEISLFYKDYPEFEQRLKEATKKSFNKKPLNIYTDIRYREKIHQSRLPKIIKLGLKIICVVVLRYFFFIVNLFCLSKEFSKTKIDILHVVNGGYPGADSCRAAVIAGRLNRIPCIIMSQLSTPYPYSNKEIKPLEYLIDKLVYKVIDLVISPANNGTMLLNSLRKFPLAKLKTAYLGITPFPVASEEQINSLKRQFGISSTVKVIGMIGLFEEYKGHRYLIQAIPEIKRMGFYAKYIFVGAGRTIEEMKKLVQEYSLSDDIIFTGYLGAQNSDPSISDMMNIFDIFVHPSLYEGTPLVILEAMSLYKPIIATNVGGIPEEIENNISGIIIPPHDSNALSNAIITLLRDENLREKIGVEAKKRFEQYFTVKQMISAYELIYESVLYKEPVIVGKHS